jgi:hypothetical protein
MKPVVAVLLLIAAGSLAYTQAPQPGQPRPPTVLPSVPVAPGVPTPEALPQVVQRAAEPTVEQMLDQLEKLKAQKAALEKQEAELSDAIRKKLEQQGERLKRLGLTPGPAAAAEPDRVGQVMIKGATPADEKKILAAVKEFQPGAVLQYPVVAEAEERLKKAGYPMARVEVRAAESDSAFKDIVITVVK